jgi:uncharacterized protein (DUF1697 family)
MLESDRTLNVFCYAKDMTYVVLLRGINVGGLKMPMSDLKTSLSTLSLDDIKTYLASGNVSFSSSLGKEELKKKIEFTLSKDFSYTKEMFIYTSEELALIIDNYPFASEYDMHRYVIFSLNPETIDRLVDEAEELSLVSESIKRGEDVLYWTVSVGLTLDSSIGKLISNKHHKDQLTTRNLKTLDKINNFVNTP